jgi:hypothetical protein
MDKKLLRLLERFPKHGETIKALYDTHELFKDLIADHHAASEELESMSEADRESENGRAAELKARCADLEEEMRMVMETNLRV